MDLVNDLSIVSLPNEFCRIFNDAKSCENSVTSHNNWTKRKRNGKNVKSTIFNTDKVFSKVIKFC